MRIARQKDDRQDALPFQVQYLEAGQSFTGYILLQDPQLAPAVSRVFEDYGMAGCRSPQRLWAMPRHGVHDLGATGLGNVQLWRERSHRKRPLPSGAHAFGASECMG